MKKNKISKNWVNKQRRDIYVRQSKVDGYRARSAYKLIEIDEKFKIFKGGMSVIDIGAAPGSWSQYAFKKVKDGTNRQLDSQFMPVPYNLEVVLYVLAKQSDDALQIVEQILPFFQPDYTITINDMSDMGIKRDVPIVLNSISYEDNYEGEF